MGDDLTISPVDNSAAEAARETARLLAEQQRQAALDAAAQKAAQADKPPVFVPPPNVDDVQRLANEVPGTSNDMKLASNGTSPVPATSEMNEESKEAWKKEGAKGLTPSGESSSQAELAKSSSNKTAASRCGIGDQLAAGFGNLLVGAKAEDNKGQDASLGNSGLTKEQELNLAAGTLNGLKSSITDQKLTPEQQQVEIFKHLKNLRDLENSNADPTKTTAPDSPKSERTLQTAASLLANLPYGTEEEQRIFNSTTKALLDANSAIDNNKELSTDTLQTLTQAITSLKDKPEALENVIKTAAGDKYTDEQIKSLTGFASHLMSSLPPGPLMQDKVINEAAKLIQKVNQGNFDIRKDLPNMLNLTQEAFLHLEPEQRKALVEDAVKTGLTLTNNNLTEDQKNTIAKTIGGLDDKQAQSLIDFTSKLVSNLPQDPKMQAKVIDEATKLIQKVSQGSFDIKEDLPKALSLTQDAFLHLKPEERRALTEDTIKTALTLASDKLPAVDGDKEAQKEFIAKIAAEALSHIPSENLPALAEQVKNLVDMASKEGGFDLSKQENQEKLMGLAGTAYGNLDPDQKAKLATSMLTSLVNNKDLLDKAFPEYSKLMPRESMIKALDTLKDAQAMINGKDGKLDAKDLQALTASFFQFHDAKSATDQASSKIMNEIMTKARSQGAAIANLVWTNPYEAARQGHITNDQANQISSGQAQAASAQSFIPMLFTLGISGRIADQKLAEGYGQVYWTAANKAEQAINSSRANLQNDGDFRLIAQGLHAAIISSAVQGKSVDQVANQADLKQTQGLRDAFAGAGLTTTKTHEDAIKYLADLAKKKEELTQEEFEKAAEYRLALDPAKMYKDVERNLAQNTTKNGTDLRDSEGNPIKSALEGIDKLNKYALKTDPRAFDRQELQTKVTAAKAEVQDYLDNVANVFKTGRISIDRLADLKLDDPLSIPAQLRSLKADGTLYTSFEKKTAEDVNQAAGTRFSKGQDSQYNFYVLSGKDKDGKDTASVVATTKDGKYSWVRGTDDKGEAKWSASLEPGMAEAVRRADKGYASLDSYSSKSSEARNYTDSLASSATGKVIQDLQAKGFLSMGQLVNKDNKFAGYTVDGKQYLGYEVNNRRVYMKEDGSSVYMDAAHEKAYNKAFEGVNSDIANAKEAAAGRYIAAIDELKGGTNGFDKLPEYLKQQESAQKQTQQPAQPQPTQPLQQQTVYQQPVQYRTQRPVQQNSHQQKMRNMGNTGKYR